MRTEVEIVRELRELANEERTILFDCGGSPKTFATAHPDESQAKRLREITKRVAELHAEAAGS